jgi:anti-sigma-K factor RskA
LPDRRRPPLYAKILSDASFPDSLLVLDQELAERTRQRGWLPVVRGRTAFGLLPEKAPGSATGSASGAVFAAGVAIADSATTAC